MEGDLGSISRAGGDVTNEPLAVVSIDTEEDHWGADAGSETSARNVQQLFRVQELFEKCGARPTYLANYAVLESMESVAVLSHLASKDAVEIGVHCHPWNTPPFRSHESGESMMNRLDVETNTAKVRSVVTRLKGELGVNPQSFRAGRWGFGPTVAGALKPNGLTIDCSVTPGLNWGSEEGPDYTVAPDQPYRFHANDPFTEADDGELFEVPITVGFLRGRSRRLAPIRDRLSRSPVRRTKVVGALDRLGLLTQRTLSPEVASVKDMRALIDAQIQGGASIVHVTFHSSTLLPGATPFVRDATDRRQFLKAIDLILGHCRSQNLQFATISEVAQLVRRGRGTNE